MLTTRLKLMQLLLAAAIIAPLPAAAADWKPTRAMTMIVTSGAGTAYDVLARAMAKHWEKYFGVRVAVQNVKGAGGALGLDRVATSKPDGQTIGFMSRSAYLRELMRKSFPWQIKDVPLVLAAKTPPYAVTTGAKSHYKTWDDVRKAKDVVRIGIPGRISTDVVTIKDLLAHGRKVTTASMGGTNQIVVSLVAGDLDIWTSVASVTTLEPIKDGNVRPLFVYALKRYSKLPDTPTMLEIGMDKKYASVNAVRLWFAPLGTPVDIQKSLGERMTALLNDPEIKGWASDRGLVDELITGAEAKASQEGLHQIMQENDDIFKKYGG